MRVWTLFFWALLTLAPTVTVNAQSGGLEPSELTVDSQHSPFGTAAAHPTFAWTLRSSHQDAHDLHQSAYRILVATSAARLTHHKDALWDSGRAVDRTYWQRPYLGPALQSHTTYYWKVQTWDGGSRPGPWSEVAHFTTALLSESDWTAHWIAAVADSPSSTPAQEHWGMERTVDPPPLPVFRHDFIIRKSVVFAILSVVGLGQYEVRLNGKGITDTVLNPGWTDYRKTVSFDTYDVTSLLHTSSNTFGVLLGNGMYNVQGVKGHYTKFIGSFGQLKCLIQLDVRYADGTSDRFISDPSWKTHSGPILYSSIYGGETYDANALPVGWDLPGFDSNDWQPALEVAGPGGRLIARSTAPMVIAETYQPVRVTTPKLGVMVYDLGLNMSGWPSMTVEGPAGSRVSLLAGELLDQDGTVTQHSANASPTDPVLFSYILHGGRPETWRPRFSYYSFRYVQVTTEPASSAGSLPRVSSLQGNFVHASASVVGQFSSSDTLFNRIHVLIDRAVLSNLASVVTDCPSREKLGWLEQTYLNASTLMLNYDVTGLYEKMSGDMIDAQLPDGLVPSIAPEFVQFVDSHGESTDFRDSPEWGSAIILSPWALYRHTGDARPLAASYEGMKRYAAYLKSRSLRGLLNYGLGDWYDLGPKPLGPSQLTSKMITATGVYYEDLQVLTQIARLLGHSIDAKTYADQATEVHAAYNKTLFNPDTSLYDRGSQTAQAIPLALKLVPPDRVSAVLEHLVADIRSHGDHVTAGDVGFHYIVRALTDYGRSDVLAAVLSRTDSPSYGYQIARGATTLTEAWNANPDSSQNHFMLGHGEEWFYRGLAGLSIDMAKGLDHALSFRPSLLESVASASATYRSPLGLASIAWKRCGQIASIDLVVPIGAQAHLALPRGGSWKSGAALEHAQTSDEIILPSGTYHFSTSNLRSDKKASAH
ncbi:alpha-L-rhamnosidase [Granulicella arctica]|uniref:alpha-L-rhamnosidase n=1 Tax=Granulicella arctica TaxID=940613 RepID=UPI0021DFDCF4|nr:alpha-L-rhamnosidase [Granulicella arctica]